MMKKWMATLVAVVAGAGMLASGYAMANSCCESGNQPCCIEKAACCKDAE